MPDATKLLLKALKTWLAVMLLAMPLISCSSSNSPPGDGEGPDTLYVGMPECYLCHADGSIARFAGKQVVSKWLHGPHGNNESIDWTILQIVDRHPDNEGLPYYGYLGLGTDPGCTTECHDQLGDGELLEDFWAVEGVDYLGRVIRPVIGCESCHGPGSTHFGIGPLQFPRPGPERCGQCHNDDLPANHLPHHPEADHILEDYLASPHAVSINDHTYDGDSETDVRARCSKCHTDEGGRLYKDINGGHDELVEKFEGEPSVENATPVQCRTCHNPHDPHELLLGDLLDGAENVLRSAEYRTCSNCHQNNGSFGLADGYHGENSSHSWSSGGPDSPVGVELFEPDRIIYDTHFDNPETPAAIEGYNLGPLTAAGDFSLASERLCRDCHNVHAADNTINNQWASSAHAGHIMHVKEEADASDAQNILDAAVQDTAEGGSPWAHYDWDAKNRRACQRCHTATGLKNFLAALASQNDDDPDNDEEYDPVNNDFSHLEGWERNPDTDGVTSSGQNEMLYCWGCHANNSGELRDPGPITVDYANVPYTYPDLLGSNVCMACHTGRETGESIKNATGDFSDRGFINSHYLAAGGTVFTTTGYEFDGRDYTNSIYFMHDRVGLVEPLRAGDNGPCVGCHMKTEESHLFLPVKKDANGVIIELTAFEQTCSDCHSGPEELMDIVHDLEEGLHAAMDVLKQKLADSGYYFQSSYPYFFIVEGSTDRADGVRDWTVGVSGNGKNNMGAAFNYNLIYHDPGAHIHNLQYTRKLIYDSIDFMDDGSLNLSVEATLGAGKAFDFLGGTRL